MIAVVNAGPLMVLGKLNLLHLLPQLYDEAIVPSGVYHEVVTNGIEFGYQDAYAVQYAFGRNLLKQIVIDEAAIPPEIRSLPLGVGEIQVIHLALQMNAALALLDDRLAREAAAKLGLQVKGSVGVIVSAYRHDLLSFDEVSLIFETLKSRPDIWLSVTFLDRVWQNLKYTGNP